MTNRLKPDSKRINAVALVLYGLILLSLILIYRDLLMTVTCVTIMGVLLIQYFVPIIREKKRKKADAE